MNVKMGNLKSSVSNLWSVVCLLSSVLCRLISTTVERALQIHLFLTNKANFKKSQVNLSDLLIREYEQMDTWSGGKNKANSNPIQTQFKAKTNPIRTQNKPNSKPIYCGVASGEAGSNPIYRCIASMNRICCVYALTISFDSAKMAQYNNNWNLKKGGKKKFNLLYYKRLNRPNRLRSLIGTPFAHFNRWNFLYTDNTQ
jgi:hypothetical protein